MPACYRCKCNFCARNCNLYIGYCTPGEADEPCFNCDDCRAYSGDWDKKYLRQVECPHYQEAQKYTAHKAETELRLAERRAKRYRESFVVIDKTAAAHSRLQSCEGSRRESCIEKD